MQHKNNFLCERLLSATVVLLLLCTISTAPAQTTLPAEDIAEKALAATVYLEMKDKSGKTLGIGSGFFIKPNLIATNYHVIEGAARGTAKLVGKYTTYNIEGVTATDKTNDLALLKVTAYGIKPLSLGNSDAVRIGETVYVAGNPKGFEGTFSDGIISSRRDKYTKERLQMTAPISPGSSGGPVLNRKCEVIGVSFAGHRALDAQNLNFAIPSKFLKKLLEQLKPTQPLSQVNKQSISAETYFLWGNAKYELRDYVGAIADYTMAIQLDHVVPSVYHNRGLAKDKLEHYFDAITDYDIAIRLKPDYAYAYINRGVVKTKLGQYFAAISDYDIAIRINPEDSDAYVGRGMAKHGLGQYAAAISDFDIAIRLKPDSVNAYNNRGLAKYQLGQYFATITDYDLSIRFEPDDAHAYYMRGSAKYQLGQYFAAISDYDIAIRLKPDYARVYFGRALARGLLGYTLEQKQDLQTALELAKKAGDTSLETKIESMLQKIMKVK